MVVGRLTLPVAAVALLLALSSCTNDDASTESSPSESSEQSSPASPSVSPVSDWTCPAVDPLSDLAGAAYSGDLVRVQEVVTTCIPDPAASEYVDRALAHAAGRGQIDVAEYLLSVGADPSWVDAQQTSVLMWAVRWSHIDDGVGPITNAADVVNKTMVTQLLLASGADVSFRGEDGHTALSWASYAGHADIVSLLLDAGADVNSMTDHKTTPLMEAAAGGDRKTVEILLQRGADPAAREERGLSALDIAEGQGNSEVVEMLETVAAA